VITPYGAMNQPYGTNQPYAAGQQPYGGTPEGAPPRYGAPAQPYGTPQPGYLAPPTPSGDARGSQPDQQFGFKPPPGSDQPQQPSP
jgi:hypothetical protein